MSTPVRKTRAVSARELSRRMASLLDEMESDEVALIVMRYGRPSAILVPFEEVGGAQKMPRLSDVAGTVEENEHNRGDDPLDVPLDPDQEWVLLDIAHCPHLNWSMNRVYDDLSRKTARLVAFSRLELAGLVERDLSDIRLTCKGRRLARRLDSSE